MIVIGGGPAGLSAGIYGGRAKLDVLIIEKENLISEYENYKKSLIYEYVTGKKRVDIDEGDLN